MKRIIQTVSIIAFLSFATDFLYAAGNDETLDEEEKPETVETFTDDLNTE